LGDGEEEEEVVVDMIGGVDGLSLCRRVLYYVLLLERDSIVQVLAVARSKVPQD
jgi:hypothetical protein